MEINDMIEGDVHIFKLIGRLDSGASPEFDRKISQAVDGGDTCFLIDFENLEYISSAGLRVLRRIHKKVTPSSGKVMGCNMMASVKELFEVTGFDAFVLIQSDRKNA